MTPYKISDKIYYSGVNDRTTDLFEGLWSLPYGVSYNTYLVKGEKTVLMDGVSLSKVNDLLSNIHSSAIDYLVVHHMEPDHSAAIPGLCDRFPKLKIVCNAKAAEMIAGFYGIADAERFLIVKEGDVLDLGCGVELKFFMTPMVHWPETMMSWLECEQTLFSGDAFGCFGALNGAPVDCAAEQWNLYESEMRRYYAAIVAKYGKQVQLAFKKLGDLQIARICPTHGPVWQDKAQRVLALYDEMSAGKTEKGVVIVYGTMYGNTSSIAETAARRLKERGVQNVVMHDAGRTDISRILADIWRYKGLIIGSPTYSMNVFPPVEAVLKALEVRELKNRVAGAFGSFAWASAAAKIITARLEALGLDFTSTVAMKLAMNPVTEQETIAMADAVADKVLAD